MYTKGSGPIYTPLGAKAASNFYKLTSTNYSADITKDKNDEENSVFNCIQQASTNSNAKSSSARTTDEQTKIVATSTITSDKSKDLVDAANNILSSVNGVLATDDESWVYAELGDYLDEVVQTSIELSQPSGEPPLDDATKQQMAAAANEYMAQDGANGASQQEGIT